MPTKHYGPHAMFQMPVWFSYSKLTGIVQNDWYDVGFDKNNVVILWLKCKQDNDDATARNIEFDVNLNSVTYDGASQAMNDNTTYYGYTHSTASSLHWNAGNYPFVSGGLDTAIVPMFGGDFDTMQMRTTSAVGTNLKFYVDIRYAQLAQVSV